MATKADEPTELAKQIAARRNAKGWQQEDLAYQLGCSERQVQRWEAGDSVPRPHNRNALIRELEFSSDELERLLIEAQLPGYVACSLGQAQARLGGWEALGLQIGEILAQFPIPDTAGNFMGHPTTWLSIYEKSPDTGVAVLKGKILAGYWHCVAVPAEVYDAILRGENVNGRITEADVRSLLLPGQYDLYFVDLFERTAHQNPVVHGLLLRTFVEFLRGNAEQGIFIRRIVGHISSTRAKDLCQHFGFMYVRDHQTHTMAKDVPSWVFELMLDPTGEAYCFQHDHQLRRLYKAGSIRAGQN